MDERKAICLFEENIPKNMKDIKRLGFKLTSVGTGLFRRVYQLDDLNLVVKIPKAVTLESSIFHSRKEVQNINKIKEKKKYKFLRRYLPEIRYFNRDTGVILMPFYRKLPAKEGEIVANIFSNLIEDVGHYSGGDIHSENVARDDYKDVYIITDLGYF